MKQIINEPFSPIYAIFPNDQKVPWTITVGTVSQIMT